MYTTINLDDRFSTKNKKNRGNHATDPILTKNASIFTCKDIYKYQVCVTLPEFFAQIITKCMGYNQEASRLKLLVNTWKPWRTASFPLTLLKSLVLKSIKVLFYLQMLWFKEKDKNVWRYEGNNAFIYACLVCSVTLQIIKNTWNKLQILLPSALMAMQSTHQGNIFCRGQPTSSHYH